MAQLWFMDICTKQIYWFAIYGLLPVSISLINHLKLLTADILLSGTLKFSVKNDHTVRHITALFILSHAP